MMYSGCVLSELGRCSEYCIDCKGAVHEKKMCPKWGAVIATEDYYSVKLTYIKEIQKEE